MGGQERPDTTGGTIKPHGTKGFSGLLGKAGFLNARMISGIIMDVDEARAGPCAMVPQRRARKRFDQKGF